ncbi:MAG TPA: hypothetical protein VGK19_24205 [Capsulimonadaceae bacterium]
MSENASQTIGWQGITLNVPEDWAVTGFGGDVRNGTLRVDAGGRESKTAPSGLEVRWIDSKKAQTEGLLQDRLKLLLKAVEKAAHKEKTQAETWTGTVTAKRHEDRPAEIAFRWSTSSSASGRIWYCETCGRIVITQVYGPGGARFLDSAGQILSSIGCHGSEVGWRTWALYALETQAPAEYTLAGQQVLNIHLQLRFNKARAEEALIIEQWSLANVQLKNMYLDEWFEVKAGTSLSHVKYEKTEEEIDGHSVLALSGKKSGIIYWLSDGLRDLMRFRIPATRYEAMVWECPDSNKAYLIQCVSRRSERDLVREIAGRTRCHAR